MENEILPEQATLIDIYATNWLEPGLLRQKASAQPLSQTRTISQHSNLELSTVRHQFLFRIKSFFRAMFCKLLFSSFPEQYSKPKNQERIITKIQLFIYGRLWNFGFRRLRIFRRLHFASSSFWQFLSKSLFRASFWRKSAPGSCEGFVVTRRKFVGILYSTANQLSTPQFCNDPHTMTPTLLIKQLNYRFD